MVHCHRLYRMSLSPEAPNYCLCIQSNSAGFSFVNTDKQKRNKEYKKWHLVGFSYPHWQTGSFKACQAAFQTEFGERRAPSKCCIQKLVKKLRDKGKPIQRLPTFFGAYWRAKCTKIHPAQLNNSKMLHAKRFKPSTSTLWEKYSRIWRNTFQCAWMWKETSFSIDYEQVLFCVVPGMCI